MEVPQKFNTTNNFIKDKGIDNIILFSFLASIYKNINYLIYFKSKKIDIDDLDINKTNFPKPIGINSCFYELDDSHNPNKLYGYEHYFSENKELNDVLYSLYRFPNNAVVKVEKIVMSKDNFLGYTYYQDKSNYFYESDFCRTTADVKIKYLELLKKSLEDLHKTGLVHDSISFNNLIINEKSIPNKKVSLVRQKIKQLFSSDKEKETFLDSKTIQFRPSNCINPKRQNPSANGNLLYQKYITKFGKIDINMNWYMFLAFSYCLMNNNISDFLIDYKLDIADKSNNFGFFQDYDNIDIFKNVRNVDGNMKKQANMLMKNLKNGKY